MNEHSEMQVTGMGIGTLSWLTFIVFLILKLTGVITWAWWLVWLPIMIWGGLTVLGGLIFIVALLIVSNRQRRYFEDNWRD